MAALSGVLEYAISTPYTVTEDEAVGPTSDTALRASGDLPHPGSATSSTDANTIYLDPVGGSDSDSGATQALAKLTFAGAMAVVTATRSTIHIQGTTGTDQTLSHNLTGTYNFDADLVNIQVHPGQTCTITVTGNGEYTQASDVTVNGLKIVFTGSTGWAMSSSTLTLQWSDIRLDTGSLNSSSGSDALTLTRSKVIRAGFATGDSSTLALGCRTLNVTRSIVAAPPGLAQAIILGSASGGTACVLNVNGMVISGGAKGISLRQTVAATTVTAFKNVIIDKVGTAIDHDGAGVSSPDAIPATYCLVNAGSLGIMTLTSTTNLQNKDPLFLDEGQFDFRLAHRGRTFDGVPYPTNSPAVDTGETGADMGAFEVTYTAGAVTSETLTLPDDLAYEVDRRRVREGFERFKDIRGFTHAAWDSLRSGYVFAFTGGGDQFAGSDFTFDLEDVAFREGLVRWWPNGTSSYVWSADWTQSNLDTAAQTITATLTDLARALRKNANVGWICRVTFNDGVGDRTVYARIVSHTATAVNLERVRGDSFSSLASTAAVACIYFPCILDMDAIESKAKSWSEDTSVSNQKGLYKASADDLNGEFHATTFTITETYERGDE